MPPEAPPPPVLTGHLPSGRGRPSGHPVLKAIKFIVGILFATVGLFFTIVCAAMVVSPDADGPPIWWVGLWFVVAGLIPFSIAWLILNKYVRHLPPQDCPNCGASEHAPVGSFKSSRNWLLLHLIGLPLMLLLAGSRRHQVRCVTCEQLYFMETRGTRIATLVLWVALTFLLLASFAGVFIER